MKHLMSVFLKFKKTSALALAALVVGTGFASSYAATCPTNDIMPCGATSPSNFINKLKADSPGDLKTIYANSRYDLPASQYDRFASEAVSGRVDGDGVLRVDGKIVGTDSKSIGRNPKTQSNAISIGGKTYYETYDRYLIQNYMDAWVLFDEQGKVQTVILKECGNPVTVTPKNPSYSCDLLKSEKIDRDTYRFSTDASATNGATIAKVVYDFGDGSAPVTKTSPSDLVTHNYASSGSFTAKVTVYVNVPGSGAQTIAPAGNCVKSISVAPEEKPSISVDKKVEGVEHKTVGVNQEYTYQLVVRNTGNVDLTQVVVTDTPQAGIILVSGSQGTVTDNVWKHTISSLGAGESMSFTLKAKVPAYKAGSLVNTVCVNTPEVPGNPDDCDDATVDVPKPGDVRVCDVSTGTIITVVETDKDKYAPVDSPKCADMTVCVLATKKVETIKKSTYNESLHSTDTNKCAAVLPASNLPSTGPLDVAMTVASAGSLAGAGYYWQASRRRIVESILGKLS